MKAQLKGQQKREQNWTFYKFLSDILSLIFIVVFHMHVQKEQVKWFEKNIFFRLWVSNTGQLGEGGCNQRQDNDFVVNSLLHKYF